MDTATIAPGTVVGGRFETLGSADRGGMGLVYRARDRETGAVVALKLLVSDVPPFAEERFVREIALLSELRHPGIVRYVAHGRLRGGDPFLAMEWLDGIDLSARLAGGPLKVSECMKVLRQCTAALVEAHRLGIIHRDLKPVNIFLRDGSIDRIVLLDFGIARRAYGDGAVTLDGMVVGTPEYMSPEQACGQTALGPASDVFSLGCVLYECLTGRSPFPAQPLAAILAKIVFVPCPRVSERHRGVPADLVDLVARMLSKQPHDRPNDAIALQQEIARLERVDSSESDGADEPVIIPSAPLTASEQRLVSVIMASAPRSAPTAVSEPNGASGDVGSAGLAPDRGRGQRALLERLDRFDARVELLADGSLVATLSRLASSAVDLAGVAARCALVVRELWPGDHVVLAMGRGVLREGRPAIGEAIERAVGLLLARSDPSTRRAEAAHGVWLDDATDSLLSARFARSRVHGGVLLSGERATLDEGRVLLGRPSPCVGREVEIGALEALFTGSIEDSVARGALLTAEAGMGKSRVRQEVTARLRARFPGLKLLIARGDPLGAGSPYAMLSQALCRRFGLSVGASVDERRARLASAVLPRVNAVERGRLLRVLEELCGSSGAVDVSSQSRALALEPKVLSDEIRSAMIGWIRSECMEAPLLLVLDDLQWGDALTMKLIDDTMRELSTLPFMVLGVARPEISDLLPGPRGWVTQELTLRPLSERACEQLVREVMGGDVPAATVARIFALSCGNALFLEELIRAEVEGRSGVGPEPLIMMLQARLLRLEQGARRVLRAASVFGEVFWSGGARDLADVSPRALEAWLESLVHEEIIERVRVSRFPGESEYRFRHALMHEAVYRLLVDDDRQAGHAFVSRYLERAGELDPMVIAEHAARGGDSERAIRFYLRAAVLSWERNDPRGVLDRALRVVACGAEGEALGVARALACYGHLAKFEVADAAASGLQAIELLPSGSLWWCRAVDRLFFLLPQVGQDARMAELSELFLQVTPSSDAVAAYASAASATATMLAVMGKRREAARFFDHLKGDSVRSVIERDPVARHRVRTNYAWYARALLPEPYSTMKLARDDDADVEALGVAHHVALSKLLLGVTENDMGDRDRAEATLRRSLAAAATTRDPFLLVNAWTFLALALSERREPERLAEAIDLADAVLASNCSMFLQGMARSAKAAALVAKGKAAEAEELAVEAASLLKSPPPYALMNAAILIDARLAQGRAAEASVVVEEALSVLAALGGAGFSEVPILEAAVRAKLAVGEEAVGRRLLRDALALIEVRAAAVAEPTWRERFLRGRPENVRLAELATKHLV